MVGLSIFLQRFDVRNAEKDEEPVQRRGHIGYVGVGRGSSHKKGVQKIIIVLFISV